MNILAILKQIKTNLAQYPNSHVLQLQIISYIIFYKVNPNIIFFLLFFCSVCGWYSNSPRGQTFTGEYKIKHFLYIPKVLEKFV